LQFEEREGVVSHVLKFLYSKGIEVEKIDVKRPTLEDAFLKLTKKKPVDTETPSRFSNISSPLWGEDQGEGLIP
jgi:hypothetical protein